VLARERRRGHGAARSGRRAAIEIALRLADWNAEAGNYRRALRHLEAAEALMGALPPEYLGKRHRWADAAGAY
jgi:hypothetical protein